MFREAIKLLCPRQCLITMHKLEAPSPISRVLTILYISTKCSSANIPQQRETKMMFLGVQVLEQQLGLNAEPYVHLGQICTFRTSLDSRVSTHARASARASARAEGSSIAFSRSSQGQIFTPCNVQISKRSSHVNTKVLVQRRPKAQAFLYQNQNIYKYFNNLYVPIPRTNNRS